MQTMITWSQFISYLILFLLFYYGAVVVLFYRVTLLKWTHRLHFGSAGHELVGAEEKKHLENTGEHLYHTVHDLMQDCKAIFSNPTNAPVNKERLLTSLKDKISNYPTIKGTAFQVSMMNHMEQEAENKLGLRLSSEELESLWK